MSGALGKASGDTIISPEGVEERVEMELGFRITMTQGGKFRLYALGGQNNRPSMPLLCETLEEAKKRLHHAMAVMAMMEINPEATAEMILKSAMKDRK